MIRRRKMESRKPLIAANWKMYKTMAEAISFVEEFQGLIGPLTDREVVIGPPFTALAAVRTEIGRASCRERV